jgi:hypothetical protein
MHTDPVLVHTVADLRRGALLAEAAAIMRSQPERAPTARAFAPAGRLMARISAAVGWLVTEFEARPCASCGSGSAVLPERATPS